MSISISKVKSRQPNRLNGAFLKKLLSLTLLMNVLPAFAADFYVSPTGSDSAAGTLAQPWKTVNRALTGRSPGEVIHLQAGATFTENVTVASGGAAGLPVTITSDPVNRATIQQSLSTKSAIFIYNKSYITLENLIVTGVGLGLTSKMGVEAYADNGMYSGLTFRNLTVTEFYRGFQIMGYGAATYGFTGVLMENCQGNYNRDAGALTWAQAAGGIRNLTVRDSEFNYNYGDPNSAKNSGNGFSAGSIWDGLFDSIVTHDNGGLGNATAGPVGIMVYDSKRVTIQNSESYRNQAKYQDGDGFDLDLGTSDSVIQHCYSHDNYGAGYLLSTDGNLTTWANNIVRYNISENDGTGGKMGGLHFYSPGTLAPLKNSQVYGNTIYSNLSPTVWFYDFANMSGIKIRNNIFITANNFDLIKYEVNASPTTAQAQFQGNNYWSSDGTFKVAGYNSLADWRSAKSQEMLNNMPVGFSVNPLLNNPGGGGTIGDPQRLNTLTAYQLQANSPMINAGLDLPTVFGTDPGPMDFYLNPIPQSGAFDIGAAEFVSSPQTTVPADPTGLSTPAITSNSIGLSWNDNSTNENGFHIQRSSDGLNFATVSTIGANGGNVASYTDSGLGSSITYHYRVSAYNGAGDSGYSNKVQATTSQASKPAAPTGLTATAATQKGKINLVWNAVSGAASYNVKRSTTNGGPYTTITSGITGTSYSNSGLRSKTTYYYVVTAVNANGESGNSNQASATAK